MQTLFQSTHIRPIRLVLQLLRSALSCHMWRGQLRSYIPNPSTHKLKLIFGDIANWITQLIIFTKGTWLFLHWYRAHCRLWYLNQMKWGRLPGTQRPMIVMKVPLTNKRGEHWSTWTVIATYAVISNPSYHPLCFFNLFVILQLMVHVRQKLQSDCPVEYLVTIKNITIFFH
jgi:hypothetical protein